MTVGRSDGRTVGLMVAAALLSASPTVRLSAQDTTVVAQPPVRVVPTDTIRRVGPMGAFWRSLLVPGWGQAATGRNTTGALFVVWEGVTAMMTLKAQQEANYMKATGAVGTRLKRQEVQDWAVLWGFNHLFAAAEAYVSSHLQDFPGDLHVRAMPRGIGISMPLPRFGRP